MEFSRTDVTLLFFTDSLCRYYSLLFLFPLLISPRIPSLHFHVFSFPIPVLFPGTLPCSCVPFCLQLWEQFCFLNCFERGAASLCSPLPTGDVCPQLRFLGPSVLPCLVWFLCPALFVVVLEVFASWPGAFAGNFRDTWGLRQPCCLLPTSRPRVFWEPAQCAPHWGLWCFQADSGLWQHSISFFCVEDVGCGVFPLSLSDSA